IGSRLRTALVDQGIGAFEADECNRDGTVLWRPAAPEYVLADRGGKAVRQRLEGKRWARPYRHLFRIAGRHLAQEEAGSLGLAYALTRKRSACLGADEDLIRFGRALERDKSAPGGTGRHQFEMRRSDREEVEASRMRARR